jgi:hypothetical protein
MKHSRTIVALLAVGLLLANLGLTPPQEKRDIQAFLLKVIKDVSKKSTTKSWEKAIPMDRLKSGYQLKTEAGSLALIRFADESKLLVREKSIVEIKGQVQGRQIIDRDVHVQNGGLGFSVKKQETEQFRFSTPISVASIRGTDGAVDHSESDSTSSFTCVSGSFDVDGISVTAGYTYERRQGEQGQTRQNTLEDAQNSSLNTEQNQGQTAPPRTNRLEIIGKDRSGKEVKIVIE